VQTSTDAQPRPRKAVEKIGIIGGGVAGLVTAKILGQAGFDCHVFERGPLVGGVWSVGYHTYGLQTPRGLYEFPDWPMPASYPDMPSGAQIQQYLESYARHFDLTSRIQLRCKVNELVPGAEGKGWVVHYTDESRGAREERAFDYLVIATGLYSNPNMPALEGQDQFQGKIYHSSEYDDPSLVAGRKVIVVGYGKSALDIAVDASKHARETTLLFRDVHWPVPVKVLGLIDVRKIFLTRLVSGFLPLYQRPEPWEKKLHETAPWLIHGFWRMVETIMRTQFHLDECDAVPTTPVEHDLFNGGMLPTDESFPRLRSGAVRPRRGAIARFSPGGVTLADGERLDADVVIFATGWKCDYGVLPAAFGRVVEDDGLYLYRHILHPDWKDLAFIGWASTFSNSLTSHLAALWLRNLLQGRFDLPPRAAMQQEIAAMKAWKRAAT
jgi:dimethylaniline monooxygenase (N-oxide forming)